jgi:hypothetical protein
MGLVTQKTRKHVRSQLRGSEATWLCASGYFVIGALNPEDRM